MDRLASPSSVETEFGRASWLIPARIDGVERLDLGQGTLADAQASLDDMWRINRFLGGVRAITSHLYPRLLAASGTATVLDLGTGSAHLAVLIARWAQRHNRSIRVLGADINPRHLTIAQTITSAIPPIRLLHADALHLPFAENSVDYLISSLFLHHFTPPQVVALLREAYAHARRGIIFSDIQRGWLPWIGFKLSQPVFVRSPLTGYDGALSIRRAYTPAELRQLAADAGLTHARVTVHPLWRMTLTADKP